MWLSMPALKNFFISQRQRLGALQNPIKPTTRQTANPDADKIKSRDVNFHPHAHLLFSESKGF